MFVRSQGEEKILDHERRLAARAAEQLSALPGVRVYAARGLFCQSGVLSFQVDGMDCEEVGETLGGMGIAVRAGLHCAPLAHRSAGTLKAGTVRLWRGLENSSPIVRRTALRRAPSRVHFLLFSSEFKGKLMGRRIAISH